MEHDTERSFGFLHINERGGKPRRTGVTEIRGPYYTPLGKRALLDILETMGAYVDVLKFAGGSFALMPESAVRELICRRIVETVGDAVIFADRDGDGKVLGPVAVVRDVTAKWYRERLMRQKIASLEAGQTTL